ncbi:DUF1127 domain-containing protein [Photobacterium sp. TY1-4]|uniref:DUF1127 domain-containing protein n=1 Tax=Photobacterium sp. TY1-4 TaxID=2899122 RepID=UPI0021C100B4|nr:DUF1127 domain-containing protein [Photobacterium sp. TY1-4]UXI03141.1 DUF1127 domain-containing protein [Photobacterium sp. TY1-4]
MRMTTFEPVFPTVQQVVASVKRGFSLYRNWRQQRRRAYYLSDLPAHLREDIGLDRLMEMPPASVTGQQHSYADKAKQ